MAAINDLIAQIEDIALRERIAKEVDRLSKQKKFGLVFEEHLPECTPLYDIPVKTGALVAKKAGEVNDVYKVLCIEDNTAQCLHRESKETAEIALDDLVTVAEFGEPIYPYLKPIDTVCNAPDSDLWHTLIEADNYHALYATHDAVQFFVANKPNALIVDFFAGSGTTMHAVNLLNAEDGGHRRCIMVTNNEVSADEAKMLKDKGYQPGDEEWEKLGIANYVTWPRTVCSIEGHDVNGNPLKGDYLGSEPPLHMADGFKANAAFFKLGFLDPTAVSLGMRFSEMLPTLWLKAGAKGKCPELSSEQIPDMLILPENKFAVLINENAFASFAEKLAEHPEVQTVFLATDYEVNYQSMVKNLNVTEAYQLYRDYLDHFRLNRGRN